MKKILLVVALSATTLIAIATTAFPESAFILSKKFPIETSQIVKSSQNKEISKGTNKEEWEFISEDKKNGILHEADLTNTYKDKKNIIFFVHRIRFQPPKIIQGKEITHIVTLNAVDCSSRASVILTDITYNNNSEVAKDLLSSTDTPGVAESGTPHYKIVMKLCGPGPNMT